MKTATKLSADLVDTEGFHGLSDAANTSAIEVYAMSGMLFSIAACPASTADAPVGLHATGAVTHAERLASPGLEEAQAGAVVTKTAAANNAAALQRLAVVSASDEVQHKIAGNEVRNTGLLQATIDALYAQGQLSQRIAAAHPPSNNSPGSHTVPGSSSFYSASMGFQTTLPDTTSLAGTYDGRAPPPLPPDGASVVSTYNAPTKPATLLTTVVDYCGFRVTVLCPTLVEESTTLVHGCSAVPVPASRGSAGLPSTSTVQVRAAPEIPLILSNLAAQLNVTTYQRPRCVTHQRLCDTETNAELPIRNLDLLSSDLQVHAAADGRTYILNLKNILPNSLPRPHSYDVQTRQLRAEYVQSLDKPLKTDILQQSSTFSLGTNTPGEVDVRAERLVIQESGVNIAACRELFSSVLRAVAVVLDSFASVPMDSFGLTQFLHANGVNLRHIGVLYWLCSAPSVKQLLLSEALARCCKTILNAQLRQHARKTKGMYDDYASSGKILRTLALSYRFPQLSLCDVTGGVLRAQHRGRSVQHDYTEYVGNAAQAHRSAVLELFNLTLGWGPASDAFWSGERAV
jgi:hypothetical protein